jgi:alpha-L-fucosidase 2
LKLGKEEYFLENFGVCGTTISLNTETPYMKTSAYQDALDFQADIVIIMLGTNDAQPNLKENNAALTRDYVKLISAFNELPTKPTIYVVLPPPIIDNQFMNLDPEYFTQIILPSIQQTAEQTGRLTIDVYSVLLGHPEYFEDGVHVNDDGAEIIANKVFRAVKG